MSLMLNDELTPEPQGLEHIFFSTIMFHEVWVVAIFFNFLFPADVAGSATPHFLIDMVEVVERESGTEVVHCLLWHCCKKFTGQISQAHFEWLQNRYFNTPLENSVSVTLFKSVALKGTNMNSKSWSITYIIVTPARSANFFHIFITHIWHMALPVICCGLRLSNPSRLLCHTPEWGAANITASFKMLLFGLWLWPWQGKEKTTGKQGKRN